jgi:hypothetical protein
MSMLNDPLRVTALALARSLFHAEDRRNTGGILAVLIAPLLKKEAYKGSVKSEE